MVPVCADHLSQGSIQVAVRCGRQIVVARPFVAQGLLDEDHIRGLAHREDLPRRGDADQELAARGEEFLGHQHREWSANHTPDDAILYLVLHKGIEHGVVARPVGMAACATGGLEGIDQVPIGIEHTDLRDAAFGKPFLPPRLP